MTTASARYNGVAQALHWIIGLAVIATVVLGLWHEPLEPVLGQGLMQLHKSLGMSIFVLSLIRLGWRFTHSPPALRPMPGWQTAAAKVSHTLFYILMIGLPIGGYLMSSAGKYPLAWFGVPIPKAPVGKDSLIAGLAHEGHEIGGYIMAALVVLHVGAALYHASKRDGVMSRMLPGGA